MTVIMILGWILLLVVSYKGAEVILKKVNKL